MTNILDSKNKIYDLEERTAKFGEEIIRFCQTVPQDILSKPLLSQLLRAATSVGANYMEANAASSRKDFRNKIFICKKEIQETKHWLRMLAQYASEKKELMRILWKEAEELTLIFGKIVSSLEKKNIS